jgi:hypothetical protein
MAGLSMQYPTIAEVVKADHEKICQWWDSLESPQTLMQERVMNLIFKKFHVLGAYGWTDLQKKA